MGMIIHRIRQNENKTHKVGFSPKARKFGRMKQTRYMAYVYGYRLYLLVCYVWWK